MKTVTSFLFSAALLLAMTVPAIAADEVVIGYVNVMDDAPVLVAHEAGYYELENLDAELVQFASGTDLIKGIVTGRLDVGVLGFTNAVTWASRGADLRIVGGAQRGYHSLLARNDSGIERTSDLAGRSLASQKQGSTADIVLSNVVLESGGLTKRDLTLRYVSPAVAVQSLVSGAVDAAFLFEPYARIARYTAPVTEVLEIGESWPFPCMVVITSAQTWEDRRDTVFAVLDAQRRAIELLESDPNSAAELIADYFIPAGYVDTPDGRVSAHRIIAEAVEANSFDWRLSQQDISRIVEIADMMLEEGLIAEAADLDTLMDLSWQTTSE